MKELKIYVLGFLILIAYQVGYTQSVKYSVSDETKMTVSGTSTLHDWTSEVNEVKGFVEVDENFAGDGKINVDDVVKLVNISVPVKSIISPRGATMDKKTYNALKSEEHPEIIFALKDNKVTSVNGEGFTVEASGDLTIAGVTKHVAFPVHGKLLSGDKMNFEGAYKLNMLEYEMEPPTAMFGQIVTGEEVEIKFDLVVNRQ